MPIIVHVREFFNYRKWLNRPSPLKIDIAGEDPAGKTSIKIKIVGERSDIFTGPTVGVSSNKSSIEIDRVEVAFTIDETAGIDQYLTITPVSFAHSDGCILVYDVTDEHSFKSVKKWMQCFVDVNNISDMSSFPFLLLGNKCDLDKVVSTSEAAKFAKENGNMLFFEVSAETGENIQESFELLIRRALIWRSKKSED